MQKIEFNLTYEKLFRLYSLLRLYFETPNEIDLYAIDIDNETIITKNNEVYKFNWTTHAFEEYQKGAIKCK